MTTENNGSPSEQNMPNQANPQTVPPLEERVETEHSTEADTGSETLTPPEPYQKPTSIQFSALPDVMRKTIDVIMDYHAPSEQTELIKEQITHAIIQTGHTQKYLKNFFTAPAFDKLTLPQKMDALYVCDNYGASKSTMTRFIERNYTVGQAATFIEYYKEYAETKTIPAADTTRAGKYPITYSQLMFLDNLMGNHHDINAVDTALNDIQNHIQENDMKIGFAEVIHKMEMIFRSGERLPFDLLLDKSTNHINKDSYEYS